MNTKYTFKMKYTDCYTELGIFKIAKIPENFDGLRIDVFDDLYMPDDSQELKDTGLKQVHISGTKESLAELGKYLISISESNAPRDSLTHIEPVKNGKNTNAIHLVVHNLFTENFGKSIRFGDIIETEMKEKTKQE